MAVIMTKLNMVCAYQPLPDDRFVLTYVRGHKRRFLQSTRTIDQYHAAVRWAVRMADQLSQSIVVMPMTCAEFFDLNTEQKPPESFGPNDQRHFELLQDMVCLMLRILRDDTDQDMRDMAREVLVDLGVAR